MKRKPFIATLALVLIFAFSATNVSAFWEFHDVNGQYLFGYTGLDFSGDYQHEVVLNGIKTNVTTINTSYADRIGPTLSTFNSSGVKGIIILDTVLFDDQFGWNLRPDYQALFNNWYSLNGAYLTPDRVAFIVINTEVNNRHISAASIDTATAYVKSRVPNLPTVVGYGLSVGSVDITGQPLPTQPDGIAFWVYGVLHPEDPNSKFQYWLNYFKARIDHSRQRLVVVFDAFYGGQQINAGLTQDMLGPMAVRYANIVRNDPLIVGMVGFNWYSFADALGLRDLTQSVRDYNRTASCTLLGPC
jgi:hypothetical protein